MWKYIFPIEGKHELTADLQVICSEWNVASLLSQSRPPGGGELVEGGGGGRAAPIGGGRGGAALPGVGGRVRSWDSCNNINSFSSRYVLQYMNINMWGQVLPVYWTTLRSANKLGSSSVISILLSSTAFIKNHHVTGAFCILTENIASILKDVA